MLEDLPWPLVYQEMAEAFPDAKFVLTRRASVEQWLESQTKHTAQGKGYGMHRKIYGALTVAEDPDAYRTFYERHLCDVRDFFAGTDRMTELCWEDGDGWPELCGFLGVPIPDEPFPHSNPAGSQPTTSEAPETQDNEAEVPQEDQAHGPSAASEEVARSRCLVQNSARYWSGPLIGTSDDERADQSFSTV